VLAPSADAVYGGASKVTLAGNPGELFFYLPRVLPLVDANAWLVLYRSTDALAAPIAVSGTVIVPRTPWSGTGPRPIVAFAHATVGITDDCAPSRTLATGLYIEATYVSQALARGWAVALTDYEGLGTPGRHTYCVNRSEAHAVLDSVRAAARLPGAGLDARAPVVIWGYSQGGGAAAAAAEAAPAYAPELVVKGVAAGGAVADPDAVGQAGEGTLFFGFVSAASVGLDTAYPELQLRSYLNDAGRADYDTTDTKTACLPELLTTYAFRRTSDYTTSDPRPTPAWQKRLQENKLGFVKLAMPALVYHGAFDEVIPTAVGEGLRDRWCAHGATVQWSTYVGDHVLAQAFAAADAVTWLADRLEGKPASSSCP
jgi:pimeloyl-ACP methyl ester carboxylesterase